MKVLILAAGRGTRLGMLTRQVPKPLLKLGNRPLIMHQLTQLASAGITQVVINLHHLGEQIEAALGDGADFGLQIQYSRESLLLETGGGIVHALPLLGTAPFWLLNGDILTDFNFNQLPQSLAPATDLHLVLTPRPDFRATGDFELEAGRVLRRGNAFVYCGIALVHPRLLVGRKAEPFSLREPIFQAIAQGRVSGQSFSGYWTDIGSPAQLTAARQAWPSLQKN